MDIHEYQAKEILAKFGVTVPQGGLAPQTKQIAWDVKASCDLHTFTLQDAFIHNYGSHDDLLAAHGLATDRIHAAIA